MPPCPLRSSGGEAIDESASCNAHMAGRQPLANGPELAEAEACHASAAQHPEVAGDPATRLAARIERTLIDAGFSLHCCEPNDPEHRLGGICMLAAEARSGENPAEKVMSWTPRILLLPLLGRRWRASYFGQVQAAGITLRDGNLAEVGDWIVTRANNRRQVTSGGRDWVKNGDAWKVAARHPDGSLTVRRLGPGARSTVTLPAACAAAAVELLFATTIRRAQGATADPLVTADMSREHLYAALSRAPRWVTWYVVTHDLPALHPDGQLDWLRNGPRGASDREYCCRHQRDGVPVRAGAIQVPSDLAPARRIMRAAGYASPW
jgi:hypothetical protein